MKKIALLLCVAMFIAAPVLAEVKIGIIDVQKAIALSDAGMASKTRLEGELNAFKQQLEQTKMDLDKLRDDLGKQSAVMSSDARAAKEREFQQKVKDAQRFEEDRSQELQRLDQTLYNQLLQSFLKLAGEVAKTEGYDFVFERSSMIHASEAADFTDKLIAEANKGLK